MLVCVVRLPIQHARGVGPNKLKQQPDHKQEAHKCKEMVIEPFKKHPNDGSTS